VQDGSPLFTHVHPVSYKLLLDSLPVERGQSSLTQQLNKIGAVAAPTLPPAMRARHLAELDARHTAGAEPRAEGNDERCCRSKLLLMNSRLRS
jgi:hypothetical protein